MNHFIEQIVIDNFKSIRHLQLGGLKRINLFIGRPNVGKSNILEALSLFSFPYVWEGSRKLTDLVRLANIKELFHEGNFDQKQAIHTQLGKAVNGELRTFGEYIINYNKDRSRLELVTVEHEAETAVMNVDFSWFDYTIDGRYKISRVLGTKKKLIPAIIKVYHFKTDTPLRDAEHTFLQPPFGSNLLQVLELLPELRQTYAQWFRQYGLRLVLDTASQSLKVQKEKGKDEVFQLPYSSVADTLQRIIFYKTAVASNKNSVLLFEEPEAHAFPPYIVEFTQEVIQSLTNQFFIVTHSPLIVEEFLTNAIDDLGIFNVDFKDGQTVVRALTTEEIYDVRKYGVDLFFNNEAYLA